MGFIAVFLPFIAFVALKFYYCKALLSRIFCRGSVQNAHFVLSAQDRGTLSHTLQTLLKKGFDPKTNFLN